MSTTITAARRGQLQKLPKGEKATHRAIYVNDKTWKEVVRAAKKKKMSNSEWVRLAISDGLAVSE